MEIDTDNRFPTDGVTITITFPDITKPQTEPDDTKNTDGQMKSDNNAHKSGILQTGDDSHYEFWGVVLCLGGGASVFYMLFAFVRKRKKKLY